MVNINRDDFGVLCCFALRYCHGRQTYAPKMVQEIVMSHFDDIPIEDLKIIYRDGGPQIEMKLYGDEKIDKSDWLYFYSELRKYIDKNEK